MIRSRRSKAVATLGTVVAVGALLVPASGVWAQATTARPHAPACTNSDVKASYRGGDGAAGQILGRIVLKNVSGDRCSIRGFGGLTYVSGASHRQVGAGARKSPGTAVKTVVLRPGDKAVSQISETEAGNYPKHRCQPSHVSGLLVSIPNASGSQFIPHATTGCKNLHVHLLSHRAYK